LLRWFGLRVKNLIYAGGGNFYLLLPKAYKAQEEELRQYIDEMLLRHHDDDLYISLVGVPMTNVISPTIPVIVTCGKNCAGH
jgi:CRISPR/Cas system-associated protein Cas10 (large subunit of type III CRISPR-Cas system)